jgi:hypothetical protein
MARVWLRLAESYDKSVASGESNKTQPVMQQQQQARRPKDDDKS